MTDGLIGGAVKTVYLSPELQARDVIAFVLTLLLGIAIGAVGTYVVLRHGASEKQKPPAIVQPDAQQDDGGS